MRALSRRGVIGGLGAALVAGQARAFEPIGIVSRERLLNELAASKALRIAEAEITLRLQTSINAAQEALAAEEQELAGLRAELSATDFEARAQDFDRRIRQVRRFAQERVSFVNSGFQRARAQIVAALPSVLERLRVETGVEVILNADAVLAMDPAIDLTDRAIVLYDQIGPRPAPPNVNLDLPLLPPPTDTAPAEQ